MAKTAQIRPLAPKEQLAFLSLAAREGIDAAVRQHGEVLTAGEAAALKSLNREEIDSLRAINEKIAMARAIGSVAEDGWVCVNVVC